MRSPKTFLPQPKHRSSHPLLVISVINPVIPWPFAGYSLVHPCPLSLGAQHMAFWLCLTGPGWRGRISSFHLALDTLPDAAQEALRFWGHERALLAHAQLRVHQDPQGPFRHDFQPVGLTPGFFIPPATRLRISVHEVPVSPFLHVKVPLNSSTTLPYDPGR